MTNSLADLEQSRCILIIGSNTTECHPLVARRIMRAKAAGAKVLVVDPRPIQLAQLADVAVRIHPGTDVALLNAMACLIVKNGWHNTAFIEQHTEDLAAFAASVGAWTLEAAEAVTGVAAADIETLARVYAEQSPAAICYAMGITQFVSGVDRVMACCNLALLTGNMGVPGGGINPLRGQNNVQGACDMGGLPDVLPGYRKVTDPDARAAVETVWGGKLPTAKGLTVTELVPAIEEGKVRALYIVGENPLHSDPDINHVIKAFDKLDLLVVQDIFATETTRMAHVVLPAAAAQEKDGTFTNTERRCSRVRKAVDAPGDALPDWDILCRLARRMGHSWNYADPEAVFEELRTVTPSYAGMTYARLGETGLQWPCPHPEHPGTPILHTEGPARGKARFVPVGFNGHSETPDASYPFVLSTGRMFAHYHTATMTGASPHLAREGGEAYVEMHPADAATLGLTEGDAVRVSSRRGHMRSRARLVPGLRQGTVFVPFHYAESLVNLLTQSERDPISGITELKHCAVRLERVAAAD